MNPKTATATALVPALRSDTDSREMCFEQGKPCIYESETNQNVVICEWPNGVVEERDTGTDTVTRFWPDGSKDSFHADSPQNKIYPHIQ